MENDEAKLKNKLEFDALLLSFSRNLVPRINFQVTSYEGQRGNWLVGWDEGSY